MDGKSSGGPMPPYPTPLGYSCSAFAIAMQTRCNEVDWIPGQLMPQGGASAQDCHLRRPEFDHYHD
jgi:hypothetical protein